MLTGGGFLFHDEAQKVYAGVMLLSLHETITLKAPDLLFGYAFGQARSAHREMLERIKRYLEKEG